MTAPTERARDAAAAHADHETSSPASRRLLSKAQVAARLGCSERSLERLVKQERFPEPRRYGRAVFWFESAVEHVLGLAEQEQLLWQPGTSAPHAAAALTAVAQEPLAPGMIPATHELEAEDAPQRRKPRKTREPRNAADTSERTKPPSLSSDELKALTASLGKLAI
ncbi:MAG: hypothetical protein ABT20_18670 [Rubrivivax sp. SCN 70-15]|nr:MAG: hypothetical protein ABT20_18670 [Rubrivivax sp. SCN 70-15]